MSDFGKLFARNIGTSPVTLQNTSSANAPASGKKWTFIGGSVTNIYAGTITVDVYYTRGGNNHYFCKGLQIPAGDVWTCFNDAEKGVMENGETLIVVASVASACDAYFPYLETP